MDLYICLYVQVAQQCKENIFAVQTLKDFQFVEDNKDQGLNVREKAKALVALLKDDERLKNERTRALKAKERFAQSTAGKPNFPFMTDIFLVAKYKTQGNYRFPLPHDYSKLTVVIVQSHTFPFKILLNSDM